MRKSIKSLRERYNTKSFLKFRRGNMPGRGTGDYVAYSSIGSYEIHQHPDYDDYVLIFAPHVTDEGSEPEYLTDETHPSATSPKGLMRTADQHYRENFNRYSTPKGSSPLQHPMASRRGNVHGEPVDYDAQ